MGSYFSEPKIKLLKFYCRTCGHTGSCEWRKCKNEDKVTNGHFAERKSRYETNVGQLPPATDQPTRDLARQIIGSRGSRYSILNVQNTPSQQENLPSDQEIMQKVEQLKIADVKKNKKNKKESQRQE